MENEIKPESLDTPSISERKLRANRENAQKSTGPRTEQGKMVSRKNAVTHGFTVKDTAMSVFVNPGEEEDYQQMLEKLREELQPAGVLEDREVQQIAVAYLRLARVWNAECADIYCGARKTAMVLSIKGTWEDFGGFPEANEILDQKWKELVAEDPETERLAIQRNSIPRGKELDEIIRYKRSAERDLERAMTRLERLQRSRRGEIVPPPIQLELTQ